MEKIWLKSYPPGVPAEIRYDEYQSIGELVEASVKKYAERPAYHSMGKSLSFADLDRLTQNFGAWLQAKGLGRGARVAIMMPNVLQYPVALFGALRAGCVVVNVNPLYTARELEHQLNDSGAEVIVILENFASTLQQVLGKTKVKHVVAAALGDLLGLKGTLVNFVVRHVKKMVPAYELPNALRFNEVIAEGARHALKRVPVALEDIAFLQYTGGTTGVSKGAMLVHRNILANLEMVKAWQQPFLSEEQQVIITALPLYHIFSLTGNCLTYMKMGGCNVLITNPRDIPGFVKELAQHKFTVITGVNTLFNALLNHPDFAKLDFGSLTLTIGGGMAVQKAVADRWQKVDRYGLARGLRADRDLARRVYQPARPEGVQRRDRPAAPIDRGRAPRRQRQGGRDRRGGRALRARAAGDEGLLAAARGDGEGDRPRRLLRTPATSPRSTTRGSSASSTARRTWCSCRGSTCIRTRSRTSSPSTRASWSAPRSACPTTSRARR